MHQLRKKKQPHNRQNPNTRKTKPKTKQTHPLRPKKMQNTMCRMPQTNNTKQKNNIHIKTNQTRGKEMIKITTGIIIGLILAYIIVQIKDYIRMKGGIQKFKGIMPCHGMKRKIKEK